MAGAQETELKFQVDSAAAVEQAVASVLSGAVRTIQQIETVYYDTPGHDLRARGLTLRVRRAGDRYTQTIKRADQPGASFSRWETEHDVAGPAPQIDRADRRALAEVALRAGKDAFRPVFTVRAERTSWNGKTGETAIEVALDRGEIVAGGQTSALNALEIELKDGATDGLFNLARRVSALADLRPTIFTKGERGYRLLDESWGRAVRAEPVALDAGMTARQAFRAIALNCLQHYMLNEMVVRRACDGDAIHQSRIAVRRLRSAMWLFTPVLAGDGVEAAKADLKWLSGALGAVRDMDVFLARAIRPALGQNPDLPGLDRLAAHFETEKQRRYDELAAALGSPACRARLLNLIEWVEAGAWMQGEDRTPLALAFARRRLSRHGKQLAKAGRDLAALDHEHLHDLRKRAKRQRYASEFFAAALKGKKARARLKAGLKVLERLQTKLGRQHDFVFAGEILSGVAQRADAVSPVLLFAAGSVAADMRAQLRDYRLDGAQRAAWRLKGAAPL